MRLAAASAAGGGLRSFIFDFGINVNGRTSLRFGDGHGSPTRAAVARLGTAQPCGGAPYFVAVTNTDLWDASICTGDADRIANTLKLMGALGAGNVDLAALWTVLSTPPEFADTTLHTDAMVPAFGQYETRLRV